MAVLALLRRYSWMLHFIAAAMIAGTGVVHADPTLLLANPKVAANVRMNLARDAEREVLIASYDFKFDRVGLMTLAMLRDVARQGKRAVLLLDAFGNKLPSSILSYLAEEGVEIYQYHPFSWKNPLQYFRRHHLKLFVVDGKHLVAGDRNSGNEYFGLDDHSFISRDVYVSGKAAQDAKAHIEELIQSGEVKRIKKGGVTPFFYLMRKLALDDMDSTRLMRRLRNENSWKDDVFESDAVEFYHDPVGKKGVAPGVDHIVIDAIDKAQNQIVFENAYVVLPESLKNALQRAAERGVKIRVLTNSFESTNARLVGAAWERSRAFLASIGAEVWEHPGIPRLKEPQKDEVEAVKKFRSLRALMKKNQTLGLGFGTLHAKTMVIDGSDSYIMSYNFDSRSEKLNMEVATHVKGQKFAQQLNAEIEKDLVHSDYRRVAADGKLLLPENSERPSCLSRTLAKILESQL